MHKLLTGCQVEHKTLNLNTINQSKIVDNLFLGHMLTGWVKKVTPPPKKAHNDILAYAKPF